MFLIASSAIVVFFPNTSFAFVTIKSIAATRNAAEPVARSITLESLLISRMRAIILVIYGGVSTLPSDAPSLRAYFRKVEYISAIISNAPCVKSISR